MGVSDVNNEVAVNSIAYDNSDRILIPIYDLMPRRCTMGGELYV